jgi:uncharacterized protein YciI
MRRGAEASATSPRSAPGWRSRPGPHHPQKLSSGRPLEPNVTYFVVLRRLGPSWDPSQPLEAQADWPQHASFMDGLVEQGFVVLGGPFADEQRVVLVVEASSEAEVHAVLDRDPWSGSHLVVDSVDRWTIRLDSRKP